MRIFIFTVDNYGEDHFFGWKLEVLISEYLILPNSLLKISLNNQEILDCFQQQGIENMFRPINQGYIQHSEGSADSCQKQGGGSDSNQDHSHNHSDHMSPTSDSGSHSTGLYSEVCYWINEICITSFTWF